MKLNLFILTITFFLVSNVELNDSDAEEKWKNYLVEFPTTFNNQKEYNLRKSLFFATDVKIVEHNSAADNTYTIGHGPLSIMTEEEKQNHLIVGKRTRTNDQSVAFQPALTVNALKPLRPLPLSFDLRNNPICGKKLRIYNQGACGACFAFSALATIEWAHCIKHNGHLPSLSAQQIVSCDTYDGACNGGDPSNVFKWLLDNTKGAVATAASYPYTSGATGNNGTCKTTNLTTGATLKTWTLLQCAAHNGTETVTKAIMNAILVHGAVSNCLYHFNDGFQHYKSGVYSDPACTNQWTGCGTNTTTTHCTSLIGWGHDRISKLDYWILRNDFGTKWGIGGYMLIHRGVNMCGVESEIFYSTVA